MCVQEGTIGPDLVVKPVPASVRQHLDSGRRRDVDDDDEAFLDEEAAEDVAVKSGFPLPLALSHHIVYRRSTPLPDPDLSDYGQYQLYLYYKLSYFLELTVGKSDLVWQLPAVTSGLNSTKPKKSQPEKISLLW